jgi:hypothetical protein
MPPGIKSKSQKESSDETDQEWYSRHHPRLALTLGLASAIMLLLPASTALAQQIPIAGTTAPQTGNFTPSSTNDVTQAEFPGQLDTASGPGPYSGTIVNRSLSRGTGHGVSVNSGKNGKSSPVFKTGFEGLNLYQQRYARGGNQFTVEPRSGVVCR